jgi:hypothetical protein
MVNCPADTATATFPHSYSYYDSHGNWADYRLSIPERFDAKDITTAP